MNGHRYDRHSPYEDYSNQYQSSYHCVQLSNAPVSRFNAQSSSPIEKKCSMINVDPIQFPSKSTVDYYNQIHQQVHSRTSANPISPDHQWTAKSSVRVSVQTEPAIPVMPKNQHRRNLSSAQISLPNSKPVISSVSSNQSTQGDDPILDYPNYTIDSLIDRLIPKRSYIPKQTFLHSMLLCCRIHIRPSLFLEKLGDATFDSLLIVNRREAVRICRSFLHILVYWIRTFPYDFRQREMISKLEHLFRRIVSFESTFQLNVHHISIQLQSKLDAIDRYEKYIENLQFRMQQNLTRSALMTDIVNECPTSLLFAQQLTHIELDRFKPIGAEELLQHFISKSALEKSRTNGSDVHDQKTTICLDAYIQWCNRLTSFVATETLKHTQRRLRIQMINYFIDTADHCCRLNNFNSMSAIIGGLNSQSVRRLKKTWENVQMDKFQSLDEIMFLQKNFSNYRIRFEKALKDVSDDQWATNKIVIPILSIVLRDVYFVKAGSGDYTSAGGINLQKYYFMTKCISEEFMQCKQSQFSVERNEMIINYINTSPTFDEDALLLASFECEPPMTSREEQRLKELQAKRNR